MTIRVTQIEPFRKLFHVPLSPSKKGLVPRYRKSIGRLRFYRATTPGSVNLKPREAFNSTPIYLIHLFIYLFANSQSSFDHNLSAQLPSQAVVFDALPFP